MKLVKWLYVISIVIYGIGAALTHTALSVLESAVPVNAVVTDHEIDSGRSSDDDRSYKPIVRFRFEYEGSPYVGERIHPGIDPGYGFRFMAEGVLTDYPVGSELTAYAPKDDPGGAFLVPEPNLMELFVVMSGPACLCVALFVRLHYGTPIPRGSLLTYQAVWPVVILIAGAAIAAPWSSAVEGTTVAKTAAWIITGLLALAPPLFLLVEKNRYDPFESSTDDPSPD